MRVEPADIEALFDAIPDVLFFIKDRQGRYTHVNQTMLRRLGLRARKDVIGRTAAEIYPTGLSADYVDQDARVLSGEVIENLMELHLFANREPGWCLTCKRPLVVDGAIEGLIGISRDLGQKDSLGTQYEQLRLALAHLNALRRERAHADPAGHHRLFAVQAGAQLPQGVPDDPAAGADPAADPDGHAPAAWRRQHRLHRPGLRFQRPERLHPQVQG
jgi:hypothetical protein